VHLEDDVFFVEEYEIGAGKKRSRDEATGSAQGSTPPTSPPLPNPNKEWKKSEAKTEDLLALVNNGFPPGEGDGHVVRRRGRSIPNGEEPR
jgi:hypothetical protein